MKIGFGGITTIAAVALFQASAYGASGKIPNKSVGDCEQQLAYQLASCRLESAQHITDSMYTKGLTPRKDDISAADRLIDAANSGKTTLSTAMETDIMASGTVQKLCISEAEVDYHQCAMDIINLDTSISLGDIINLIDQPSGIAVPIYDKEDAKSGVASCASLWGPPSSPSRPNPSQKDLKQCLQEEFDECFDEEVAARGWDGANQYCSDLIKDAMRNEWL